MIGFDITALLEILFSYQESKIHEVFTVGKIFKLVSLAFGEFFVQTDGFVRTVMEKIVAYEFRLHTGIFSVSEQEVTIIELIFSAKIKPERSIVLFSGGRIDENFVGLEEIDELPVVLSGIACYIRMDGFGAFSECALYIFT